MTIGLGIIGAGIMGERLLRAAQDQPTDAVHVSGIWDQAPAALDRIAAAVPGVPRAASAEAVIEGAECVYVATPPGTHLHYARMALAAGRAVFLEKPLGADLPDSRRFLSEANGARIAVNFPFASSPAVASLASWLEGGVTGAPRGFSIDVGFAAWPRPWQQEAASWLDGRAEGGFTREVVSHFLFLSRRLLGPLHLQSSYAEYPGPERSGTGGSERSIRAKLDAGGLPGRLQGAVGGTAAAADSNAWTIHGVADMRLRDWSIAERQRPDGTWVPDPDALPNERLRPLVLHRQLQEVARMARGEAHRLATVTEAYEVQEVVEAILSGTELPGVTRRE
jgi:predicted dehydrogenase